MAKEEKKAERLDKKEARIRARRSKLVRKKSGQGVFDKKDGGFKEKKFKRFAKKHGRLSDKLKKVSGKSKNADPYAVSGYSLGKAVGMKRAPMSPDPIKRLPKSPRK